MVNSKKNPRRTKSRTGGSYLRSKIAKRKKKQVVRAPLKGYLRTGGFYDRGQELKYFDTEIGDETIENVGAIIRTSDVGNTGNFLTIVQGTGPNQRIGKKIVLKSVSARIAFLSGHYNSTVNPPQNSTLIRMVCVLDTQTNGAVPAWTDIFAADNLYAPVNLANSERFRIIKEWMIDMVKTTLTWDATEGWVQDNNIHTEKWNTKLDIPIEYSSTTGAITEIRSNNIYFFAISGPSGHLPTVNGWVRWRYDDS